MEKIQYTLKAGSKEFVLGEFQSPRGLRVGICRPASIKVEINKTFDYVGLHKHIEYLQTLLASLEYKSENKTKDCKYYPCHYNGKPDCTHPFCTKYKVGDKEPCKHEETFNVVRFGIEVTRCKICDSFWF